MLPSQHKLANSEEFKQTIRKGKRAGRDTVVVHLRTNVFDHNDPNVTVGGPRCGLVVSKAVGNAVTRHAVSRKLRHVFLELAREIPADHRVVIRALPPAATATFEELLEDVRRAYEKARKRAELAS